MSHHQPHPSPPDQLDHPSPPRRSWAALALLAAAQFMVVLDITIVNVALPSIGAALDLAPADLSWVVTAYVVMSGGLLLVGGRIADTFGRRRLFLIGLLVFTAASLAAGAAPSAGTLIAARALQGMGASVLTPSALAIVTTTYQGAQRTTALSLWGAIASAGVGLGVLAGGLLTTWLSWRWVFLVNVPVGLVAAVLTPRVVAATPPVRRARALDLPGAAAVVGGLFALVLGVTRAPEHGWGAASTVGLLVLAAALLAGFGLVERRAADPLVPPTLWEVRSLVRGAAIMLGATALMAGSFFLNSVYLQGALGWSALDSGLAFLPFVAAITGGVHVASRAIGRAGSRTVVAGGLTLVCAGALLLALAPDQAGYAADLLPGFVVLGLGVGAVFPAVSITALHDVDHERAGLASGLMSTAHEVGAALGVAVLSAVSAGASGGLSAGYGEAFLVAAIAAGLLAVGALGLPAVRPAPGVRVAAH